MLADEHREKPPGDRGANTGESKRLVEEVRTALEEHDRRSEMTSPDPATREHAQRRGERERVARDEARRLREARDAPDAER